MSNILSKIRLRTAQKSKNKFDLSCDHITTSDFMRCQPVYFKPIVPGESVKINCQTFTRLAPLVNPMYGRCRIINRAFFVPMRTIFKYWNEFITDTPVDNVYLKVPRVKLTALADALAQNSFTVTSSQAYDFKGGDNYYRLSADGRKMWTVLQSLGYRFSPGYYLSHPTDESYVSALPLLAYVKIYKDWYKSQQYTNVDEYIPNSLFELSVDAVSDPYLTNVSDVLGVITTAIYDQDYFTSAWDRPVSPNDGLSSNNSIPDITNDRSGSNTYASGVSSYSIPQSYSPSTPSIKGVASNGTTSANTSPFNITTYALDVLKSLSDYLKRHQLAGGLAMDRMFARFGMKPSDAALNRSVYLGKDEVNVQIADVMATSNGEVQISGLQQSKTIVGDYAGKGVGYSDNGHFSYDSNEYGYLIIVSSLVPKIGYVQGMNRTVLHLDRLDFFTPEFDSLGVQAIARKELLSNYNRAESTLNTLTPAVALDGVFGYTSKYAEYKCAFDNMTGDFTVPSLNNDSSIGSVNSSWHLNRLLDPSSVTTSDISHNYGFVTGHDASQFDRVFSIPSSSLTVGTNNTIVIRPDHFINIYHFNVVSYLPMSKMFDDYDFDGGSNDVTIDVNGTQLN